MTIELPVRVVREALRRAAGPQASGNGEPATLLLGSLFHRTFQELLARQTAAERATETGSGGERPKSVARGWISRSKVLGALPEAGFRDTVLVLELELPTHATSSYLPPPAHLCHEATRAPALLEPLGCPGRSAARMAIRGAGPDGHRTPRNQLGRTRRRPPFRAVGFVVPQARHGRVCSV